MPASTEVRIDGAYNARVFGDARKPWLVRSSALDALTVAGATTLSELGVRRVVDLRRPGEGGAAAHDIAVVHVPVYRPEADVPLTGRLEDIFDRVLDERGEALVAAVAAIAETDGAVAVHCTIGKDRTGLVVALALLSAGVPEVDVVADYALSGIAVQPFRRAYVEEALAGVRLTPEQRAQALRLNLESPPEVMVHLIGRMNEWGGATDYLLAHGLTTAQLTALRSKPGRRV